MLATRMQFHFIHTHFANFSKAWSPTQPWTCHTKKKRKKYKTKGKTMTNRGESNFRTIVTQDETKMKEVEIVTFFFQMKGTKCIRLAPIHI
jgi:hypothetical protein